MLILSLKREYFENRVFTVFIVSLKAQRSSANRNKASLGSHMSLHAASGLTKGRGLMMADEHYIKTLLNQEVPNTRQREHCPFQSQMYS